MVSDASAVLSKDALLRDNPPDPKADENDPPPQRFQNIFTDDRPETMTYLSDMRQVIDEFADHALFGEVQGKTDRIGHFYGNGRETLRPRMSEPRPPSSMYVCVRRIRARSYPCFNQGAAPNSRLGFPPRCGRHITVAKGTLYATDFAPAFELLTRV
jgi:hypothetical protein